MSDWESGGEEATPVPPSNSQSRNRGGFGGGGHSDVDPNFNRGRGRGRARPNDDSFGSSGPGQQSRNGFGDRPNHNSSMWGGGGDAPRLQRSDRSSSHGGGYRSFENGGRGSSYGPSRGCNSQGGSRYYENGGGGGGGRGDFNNRGGGYQRDSYENRGESSFGSRGGGFSSNNRGGFERDYEPRGGSSAGHSGGGRRYDGGFNNGGGGGRGGTFDGTCYTCGQPGHSSRNCSNGGDGGGGGNRPNSNYVPVETPTDKLRLLRISAGSNFKRYMEQTVEVSGDNPAPPISTFEECQFRQIINANIAEEYKDPMPIQKYAIPNVMAGRDLMACSQTGSGKTAAYLLPMIHNLLEVGTDPRPGENLQTPEVVVIAPTRELAIQIKDEARLLSKGSILKCIVVYGGTSVRQQIQVLRGGVNILVATPGRLKHFVDEGFVSFTRLRFLVLDEADRMLEMNFMDDVETVINHSTMVPKEHRQTLMFSATFPEQIQSNARNFLKNGYLFVKVGVVGAANTDVKQSVLRVPRYEKQEQLVAKLKKLQVDEGGKISKVLIFTEMKKTTDFLATYLCHEKFKSTTIHGDRLQQEREEALADFKSGRMPILIATNVAARGLDIHQVSHVINYDLPKEIEEYVHRIGRTGRVGNTGTATSFYDDQCDSHLAKDLVKILAGAHQEVEDWLQKEADRSMGSSSTAFTGYNRDIREKVGPGLYGGPALQEEEETWE